MAALQLIYTTSRKDQDLADAAIVKGVAVPFEVTARLQKVGDEVSVAKRAIFADLKPLVHLACMVERQNPYKTSQLPCQSFDLFPKRAGT